MKLSQLSLADYNKLDNIPVVNQDLSATDFTPVANTYYKHIGATTDLYTNGVIYYYNSTGYAALDGSASGLATVAKTGSYNDLSNIPVISQDLTASGFTPVANTYYRHTGATTDMFTQGVIYLYDTAYHKLGESGGDYLTYKGDWVTNTAYNVNECVTWTDGHLYEVIKAHTSSESIKPDNAEYYKAMTKKAWLYQSFTDVNDLQKGAIIREKISKGAYNAIILAQSGGINYYLRPISNNRIGGICYNSMSNELRFLMSLGLNVSPIKYNAIVCHANSQGENVMEYVQNQTGIVELIGIYWEE